MKVVASVQAKRSSSRGLIHYIAHSKVDGEKDLHGREIFNEYTNQLDVEKANGLLAKGISGGRPDNDELHHLVISLKPQDYERLGDDEKERQASFKKITRHMMKQFEKELGADKLKWAAAIHRNTENPHVHIALQKEYFDQNPAKQSLRKIPATILPHYRKSETGEKIFSEGLLIKSATERLEKIIHEKEQLRDQTPQKCQSEKTRLQSSLVEKDSFTKMPKPETSINHERDILAKAILAKYYLDISKENVTSLENHGDKRRFNIFDEVTKKHRTMSLFDLERRARFNAEQIIKKQNLTDTKAGEELKKKLIAGELTKNEVGIKRIKTILNNLLKKENQTMRERENDYKAVKPPAEKIRNNYRKANRKLPTPNLSREELGMIQASALEKKEFRTAIYLERVRRELSLENGTETRTEEEISRLKAKQKITGLSIKLQEKQLQKFRTGKRTIPVEVKGQKRTLQEIEALFEQHNSNKQNSSGKISKVLGKIWPGEQPDNSKVLNEVRDALNEKLSEKNDAIEKNLADEKAVLKILDEFYKNDTNRDKEKIQAKFSPAELAEVESLAFELKLTDVYKDIWEQQVQLIENTSGNASRDDQNLKQMKENLLAGRALAREIICEIELARAKDELAAFKKYRDFQKFEIKDEQTGKSKFVSLSQVGLNRNGSIFDQTLEYFLENREVRRMRHQVEKQIEEKAAELRENIKAANSLLEVAGEAAGEFKTTSFFGKSSSQYIPILTPKELFAIEHRLVQTTDRDEAKNLQKILNSIDSSETNNLSALLQAFDRDKDPDSYHAQPSLNDQKAAAQINQDEVKSESRQSKTIETKTETYEHHR